MVQILRFSKTKKLYAICALGILFASCSKDESVHSFDNNKINLVIADNFNLSAFSASLRRASLDQELQNGQGPYTTLAPSDVAFANAGYSGAVSVLSADAGVISRIARYHTLDGKYELNKLPFLFNQELRSRGGRMYATHWIKGTDTVLTLNGARVLAKNIPASNGLIQVIDKVLTPYLHDLITDAISADASITLFAEALRTSGIMQTLSDKGTYTIFAPNNSAMQALGYHSVEQISATNPAVLKTLVNYHIVNDRRFIYDYILSTGGSNTTRQATAEGNSITIKLTSNPNVPGGFSGITLRGIGNTADVNIVKQDALAGNGILHIIDSGLRITQ